MKKYLDDLACYTLLIVACTRAHSLCLWEVELSGGSSHYEKIETESVLLQNTSVFTEKEKGDGSTNKVKKMPLQI